MSDLNLCHMVSQTVEMQTVGGGRREVAGGAGTQRDT